MTGPVYGTGPAVLHHGDCLTVLAGLPADSVDAVVTDPPAGIAFMGKAWDGDKGGRERWSAWLALVMAECLRVTKPGGHALVWALPRTSHWTANGIEDAGWVIRDRIAHHFGSGFPKSKALPDGWGTALKPATEDWWLARKPLTGTAAGNVQQWGTGGLNIDSCRVAATDKAKFPAGYSKGMGNATYAQDDTTRAMTSTGDSCPAGRWPANVVLTHSPGCEQTGTRQVRTGTAVKRNLPDDGAEQQIDVKARTQRGADETYADVDGTETVPAFACAPGCPVAELDQQSGVLHSQDPRTRGGSRGESQAFGTRVPGGNYAGQGGASRFFPTFRYQAKAPAKERPKLADGTSHPTVKPLALMRWLVRLVTPEGGLVLDPFAGSGTTIEACLLEGFRCIAVEADQSSVDLCLQRLNRPAQPRLFP